MYVKDKSNRITLRLNDSQFSFVKSMSDILGVSPSDFLRMVINTAMASNQASINVLKNMSNSTEGLGRENDKTDKHD